MNSIALPELAMLVLGAVIVASIPLALVWMARGSDRLRRLAWVAAFLTFDLVIFGGFTRLTDSGLGCPDWPGCFAHASPLTAAPEIGTAEALLPSGPVTLVKAWIEMIHRTLAGALSVVIVAIAVASWVQRRRPGRSWPLAAAAVLLVIVQIVFGALTVTQRLQPIIVTSHLLLGLALFALLLWHAAQFARADGALALETSAEDARTLRRLALAGAALLVLQIALGGWVSSNYAVLACTDFPKCQGQWLPPMDLRDGFSLWRDLGRTTTDAYLPFAALTAIHVVHRSMAWLVAGVLGFLALRAWRVPPLAGSARLLAALLVAQFLSGIANVVLRWPLAAGVLHNAGAAALVGTLVMLNYSLYAVRKLPPSDAPLAASSA